MRSARVDAAGIDAETGKSRRTEALAVVQLDGVALSRRGKVGCNSAHGQVDGQGRVLRGILKIKQDALRLCPNEQQTRQNNQELSFHIGDEVFGSRHFTTIHSLTDGKFCQFTDIAVRLAKKWQTGRKTRDGSRWSVVSSRRTVDGNERARPQESASICGQNFGSLAFFRFISFRRDKLRSSYFPESVQKSFRRLSERRAPPRPVEENQSPRAETVLGAPDLQRSHFGALLVSPFKTSVLSRSALDAVASVAIVAAGSVQL